MYPYIIEGEKYNVYYDFKNPSYSKPIFTEPIVDAELFDTLNSLPLTCQYEEGSRIVDFKYIIEGDTFSRSYRYLFSKNV